MTDWNDKPSRAVVACDGEGEGCVLWWVGKELADQYDNIIGDDRSWFEILGLGDAPHGLSIWEGRWCFGRWSPPIGTFRPITDAEWAAIREGRAPWDEAEWMAIR